jgi:hypothetical protein
MGRIVYNLYILGEFGDRHIMESPSISDVLGRIEAICTNIEALDRFLRGLESVLDIEEFRITISRMGEDGEG